MDTQALGIIAALGLLLPNLQAVIQRPTWSTKTKTFLTVAVSALGGLVSYVTVNGLHYGSPSDVVLWIVGVYLASVTFYHGLLKPAGIAPGIEAGTSPPAPVTQPDPDAYETSSSSPPAHIDDVDDVPTEAELAEAELEFADQADAEDDEPERDPSTGRFIKET